MKIVKFYDDQNDVMEMRLVTQNGKKTVFIYMEDSLEIQLDRDDVTELIDTLIGFLDKMEGK